MKKLFFKLYGNYPQTIAFILVSIITVVLYYPALYSGFILDDYYNLYLLEDIDARGYFYYIFSGIAGPSGRPISLLTFALQHEAWPGSPFAFKSINLTIHIINGLLVYMLSGMLASYTTLRGKQIIWFQFLITLLWLLHPMQISSVVYAVQRMTQLSALFMLAGIVNHLRLRQKYTNNKKRSGIWLMGLSVTVCTSLAVLCKENGILLPLYILVIESTIVSRFTKLGCWRIWVWVFLCMPLVALGIYLASNIGDVLGNYRSAYTPVERLITEPVALLDYVVALLLPHPDIFSLFHDDYPVSTGLLSPPKTLISIIIIISALVFSFLSRMKMPIASFAILWFLAGHSLEASYLNLELYFEHRNYLPSFSIFFIAGYFLIKSLEKLNYSKFMAVLITFYFVLIIYVTNSVLNVWSSPRLQASEWARLHPESPRALENLGIYHLLNGDTDKALETFSRINRVYPAHIYPHLKKIYIKHCLRKEKYIDNEWEELISFAENAKLHTIAGIAEIDNLVTRIRLKKCEPIEVVQLMRLMLALVKNPEYEKFRGGLHELLAVLSIHEGDGMAALENIRESVRLTPTMSRLILKFKILVALDLTEEAKMTLNYIHEKQKANPRHYLAFHKDVESMEKQLYK